MNIGILCTSKAWGGLEINTFKLAGWLKERGHTVSIYGKNRNTPLMKHTIQSGINSFSLEKRLKYGDPISIFRLYKRLQKTNTKILLVIDSKDIHIAIAAKIFGSKKIQVIYQQQMNIGIEKKDFIHTFMYKNLAAWIAPLPNIAENTLRRTNLSSDKVHIIPLCINTNYFSRRSQLKREAQDFFKVDKKYPVVGVISRLDPAKNQAVLIRAVDILKKQNFIIQALIVGDETKDDTRQYKKYLKSLTKELNLKPYIHFHSHIENIILAFACLDIFVMPSKDETFGVVTVEAMACGLPIIGAKVGGTKFLIQHGENGLHFESDNPDNLAKKILFLLKNKNYALKISSEAQKEASQKYSHHIMCQQIEKLISSLKKDKMK